MKSIGAGYLVESRQIGDLLQEQGSRQLGVGCIGQVAVDYKSQHRASCQFHYVLDLPVYIFGLSI